MAFISSTGVHRILARCILNRHAHIGTLKHDLQIFMTRHLSGFFSDKKLRLDKFNSTTSVVQYRYGRIFKEYKSRMESQLDDANADLLYEDCTMYIHMLEQHDVKNCVRIIQRCNAQLELDLQSGFDNEKDNILAPIALRKCHLLNDVEVALEVFANTRKGVGCPSALMLIMDLLYKNEKYKKCAEIACDTIDGDKLDYFFHWFYEIAVLSAFRMKSEEGLKYSIKFLNSCQTQEQRKDVNVHPLTRKRIQKLVALYCVNQNHQNAALSLIKQLGDNSRQSANIKILAYLGANNIGAARSIVSEMIDLVEKEESSTAGKKHKNVPILNKDVFFKLRDGIMQTEDPKQRNFFRFLQHNFEKFVKKRYLSNDLSYEMTRHWKEEKTRKVKSKDDESDEAVDESDEAVDESDEVDEVTSSVEPDAPLTDESTGSDVQREETIHSQGTAV